MLGVCQQKVIFQSLNCSSGGACNTEVYVNTNGGVWAIYGGSNGRWYSENGTKAAIGVFFSAAGNNYGNKGSNGCYWYSTIGGAYGCYSFYFGSGSSYPIWNNSYEAFPIRCVK